ncbi:uncharacterized protein PADG_08710 [Paracoccidioides brasiliensis Pb18]|uniref:Phenylacetyl-CoA ligase n=2 Tax=Paracoccidioides brasiliensis TaxID=121759 RepID=C1GN74_PARBD|nr:uncharacterized protein PADG_08710 [Paracoccidioides brasiliensis Pb18]EEH46276.1 hypothetical protein PADG_08710 [Paracoccidioides brasiliensis Pb18]ODH12986.1 hypothetical protein ACO22_07716 [Paracoccidioides brasiliensis]ODH45689.1 hypothetical protein GX48_08229 [Paracoccidioides brasiliensis]
MLAQSPYPPVDIPNVDLWSLLFENKKRIFPDDKVIFQDADTLRSYTYSRVKSIALDFGKGLKATWDWQKGDVLALLSPNDIDIPPVIWGTHWAGGAVTPVNPTYTAEELALQLKGTKARVLVTQLNLLPTAIAAAKLAGILDDRIVLLGDRRDSTAKFKHFTSIQNISRATRYRKTRVDPAKDLAFLSFSSGTTGEPKGVMLSHRNIVSNIIQLTAGEEDHLSCTGGKDGNGDKVLAFLPFFHIYGLTCLVHKSMYTGIQLVVMSKFDIEKWCAHVQNFGITFSYIVPPVAVLLAKHPIVEEYDLSSLRLMNSGAAPLSRELVDAVYARIKTGVKQGYGLSETSPTTHTQAWGDWNKFIGSVGRLLPNQEIKYMTSPDDGSEPVELYVGQTGEIYVRGPNVFLGYLNNPEATAACLSQDGWFRTGDVGHQDEHGNLYITDRVKELIKYKGFQVAPAELEGVLVENEVIVDVAVIGVESEVHGSEVPRAYVVLSGKKVEDGTAADAEQIVQWLSGKVAPHKRLRGGVRFVDEIPKSASGKILRRVLKDRARKEDTVERAKAKL